MASASNGDVVWSIPKTQHTTLEQFWNHDLYIAYSLYSMLRKFLWVCLCKCLTLKIASSDHVLRGYAQYKIFLNTYLHILTLFAVWFPPSHLWAPTFACHTHVQYNVVMGDEPQCCYSLHVSNMRAFGSGILLAGRVCQSTDLRRAMQSSLSL